ncbi:MAG: sensor domain-containing diguanylate cyclase [Alkalibacterium sp.]|uniref:sensor domain-containing diguanylate cyclase n=1 Tax=Alkalibacterium TaxID=99906 RepID=UPI002649542D|nr:sensor domain-containing diguanylate cyclase [Alkalibacterium sp.]MDN6194289.1 sensor domain-containing diguanylate cyclase [Alkalibacterium sp.]MDN6293649.1 sensor domain-containing diguanylate cyclase [Alkalibacterium sp.]MDN6295278.1 sensor domain-containing diguanylate cyclase [Alkalibacterium sp.]MDN6326683.1 sensor domain-containing diguanylate cyclase [Alkalibacterium sp.]MDN6385208.1 sensor domain-containing diguanylate cyclase [Alkalibacterium sp.]
MNENLNGQTKEELLLKIKNQKLLIDELLAEKEAEAKLDYPWKGNLGHWYWNIQSNDVVFNPMKVEAIGYTIEELPDKIPYSFFTDKLHPDDYERVMENMSQHLEGSTPVYEVEYRIQAKDGSWKWFYDRGKVTKRSEDGTPLFSAGIVFDVSKQKSKVENLEDLTSSLIKLVDKDELTGIRNRRAVIRELKTHLLDSAVKDKKLAVSMIDIDDFKQLNDTKGHVFGDYVLKEIAKTLERTLGKKGIVGRYGGEEFLILLPDSSKDAAQQFLENCRAAIETNEFLKQEAITISGGYTFYTQGDYEDVIKEADKNLYQSKASGKNKMTG